MILNNNIEIICSNKPPWVRIVISLEHTLKLSIKTIWGIKCIENRKNKLHDLNIPNFRI